MFVFYPHLAYTLKSFLFFFLFNKNTERLSDDGSKNKKSWPYRDTPRAMENETSGGKTDAHSTMMIDVT